MSKKSKKKFNKVEVQWKEDDLNLPTVASAIPQRHNRGGYGQSSYRSNSMNNYGDKPMESESDRGPWRRGPGPSSTSLSSSSFNNNNSFNSSRNNNNNNNSFNSSRNSFRSSRNNNSFTDNNNNNNNNSRDDNNNNASDSVHNWRDIKKKEQPKYTLNSKSSSNNSNPWRKDNNNINNINNTEMQGRGAFGSRTVSETPNINNSNTSSFSRNSFGSRSSDNNRYNSSTFANNSPSKFGSSSQSKFGSSSQSKFGAASQSKFSSGGGFAASAMKNIDNGKTRLSYSKNSRFASILDDGKDNNDNNNNNNNNKPVLQAPPKNNNNRFKLASTSSEQQAFPALANASGQVRRHEPTVNELEKEIKKKNRENNERNNAKNKLLNKKKDIKNNNNINSKQKRENNNNNNNNKKVLFNVDKSVGKNKPKGNIKKEEKKQNEKKKILIDKKLVKKFNKECLGQNKSIEINKDTERLILFGLNQKENILKRKADNYEKIAQLLSGVIFNEENINRKKCIDLDVIYDIIYNKTQLCHEKELFLALVLELLSLIEIKKSCLGVVSIIQNGNMFDKYLKKIQDIQTQNVMKEFEEYGLQYVYPLNNDVVNGVNHVIGNQCDMKQLIAYLKDVREKQMIYTNYEVLKMILIYILNKYYFSQISEDEEKNEEIAKILCMSDDINNKTEFRQLIELLHCKTDEKDDNDEDDDNEEDDDNDDDDDIDSHSLLIISNIISISSQLKNNNNGLVSILKIMELNGLISYKIIRKYVQCDDDKYTFMRRDGLSKLTDWIAELDARQARIEMEKDNEDDFDDDDVDNEYAGNLLQQRKHKTASDYETISFVQ